jgi:hypothetical protein
MKIIRAFKTAGRPKAGAIFARAAGKRFMITVRKN